MTYNRWEIWEAKVPFEDRDEYKKRPVLVLSEEDMIVLSLKMTSHSPRYHKLDGEYEIMRWQEAGLKKPTVIQCSKLLRLNKSLMMGRKYGKLLSTDVIALRSLLRYMGIAV